MVWVGCVLWVALPFVWVGFGGVARGGNVLGDLDRGEL